MAAKQISSVGEVASSVNSTWSAILLAVAVVAPLVGAVVAVWLDMIDLFARTGCLTVLFAAIAEYRLGSSLLERDKNWDFMNAPMNKIALPALSGWEDRLRIMGLWLMVVGTLIWGFGDLALSAILRLATNL